MTGMIIISLVYFTMLSFTKTKFALIWGFSSCLPLPGLALAFKLKIKINESREQFLLASVLQEITTVS
jgi:hypothetical protein